MSSEPAFRDSFDSACSLLETLIGGSVRQRIVDAVCDAANLGDALRRVRDNMRAHAWKTPSGHVRLGTLVAQLDSLIRQRGFNVLHDWDGKADRLNPDIIPVDVLNYIAELRGDTACDARAVGILIDYYLAHILALLSVCIWEGGSADENLARLTRLLAELQGPRGSGQPFADDAETLILIATSHYELDERGFDPLLDRVRSLDRGHRVNVALGHAASLGSHLRFGFEASYGRDTSVMRDDNVVDYPWLCFSLVTLMREYHRLIEARLDGPERDAVVEALLNGLSSDARAFVGERPPASLSRCDAERREFRDLFDAHRLELVDAFERFRPVPQRYSPMSFFFNFSHNVLKGVVIDALLRGEPWNLTLNDLLTTLPRGGKDPQMKEALATTLMGYARANPDTIRGRPMPVIVYDPQAGRHAFGVTMIKCRDG